MDKEDLKFLKDLNSIQSVLPVNITKLLTDVILEGSPIEETKNNG